MTGPDRKRGGIPAACLLLSVTLAGCGSRPPAAFQGYVEAEFVNVASPIGGRLDHLAVSRGEQVAAGAPLYRLESDSEAAARRQAEGQLKAAEAQLADLKLGKRPQELAVTRAQLAQAEADANRSALQLARDEAQYKVGGISRQQLDDSRASAAAGADRVRELQGDVRVAMLGSRGDQVAAQAATVAAARAAVDQAAWRLQQKDVAATRAGLVYDTLFQPGEYVNAGSPVVRMLPPENVKIRFFVPETAVGGLATGQSISLQCDGCGAAIAATITFISGEAEYTPPIIYSNETRSKLVYMIEARPPAADAVRLHPGQPVSVALH